MLLEKLFNLDIIMPTFSHLITSETIQTGYIGLFNPDSNKFEI
jgi:hypothetical protein